MRRFCFVLLASITLGCSSMVPDQASQPTPPAPDPTAQAKKYQGMIVIDNPYTISNDRLEKMNKGGFGGY